MILSPGLSDLLLQATYIRYCWNTTWKKGFEGVIKHFYLKCKLRHDLFKTFQIVHKGLVFIHLFCLSPCDATSTTTILLPKGLLDNHLYIQCSLHEYSYGLIQSENRLHTSKNNMTYVTYHNIFPLQSGCYDISLDQIQHMTI